MVPICTIVPPRRTTSNACRTAGARRTPRRSRRSRRRSAGPHRPRNKAMPDRARHRPRPKSPSARRCSSKIAHRDQLAPKARAVDRGQQADRAAAGHEHAFCRREFPRGARRAKPPRTAPSWRQLRRRSAVRWRNTGRRRPRATGRRRRWSAAWCWRCRTSARGGRGCRRPRGNSRQRSARPRRIDRDAGAPRPVFRRPVHATMTSPVNSWPRTKRRGHDETAAMAVLEIMDVGAADADPSHAQEHLARPRLRPREVYQCAGRSCRAARRQASSGSWFSGTGGLDAVESGTISAEHLVADLLPGTAARSRWRFASWSDNRRRACRPANRNRSSRARCRTRRKPRRDTGGNPPLARLST